MFKHNLGCGMGVGCGMAIYARGVGIYAGDTELTVVNVGNTTM